jgi:uncharacterized membrane protein
VHQSRIAGHSLEATIVDIWIDNFYRFVNSMGFPDPIHVILIHIPMGLILGAFFFSCLSYFPAWKRLAVTAYYCITMAFLFLFPAIIFGFMDWRHFYRGGWLTPIKIKMVLAGILLILSFLALLKGAKGKESSNLMPFLYTLCIIVVIGLGWFGGRVANGVIIPPHSKIYPAGEKIFVTDCSACHANGSNKFEPGHPLRGSDALEKLDYFISQIRSPDKPMPAFTTSQISDTDASELYNYIVDEFECPGKTGKGS